MIVRTMCDVTRRNLLLATSAATGLTIGKGQSNPAQLNKVEPIAGGVYFHQGDIEQLGHCNNGWVIFKEYVLVIDANFPSGAQTILPKIRAATQKPIRFAFDTHHHGDHAYGNQVWIDNGATAVAHTGVLEEMKKYETGYFGGKPGRWEDTAKTRPDVAASRLNPPSVLFPKELYFDDGEHRVELLHLGVAHTHGDAYAWLPKERILMTGDACVNGPHNFTGDGNIEKWIATLEAAKKLGARIVCPGHGPRGDGSVLDDQQEFFRQLREQVGALVQAKKTGREIAESVPSIEAELTSRDRIARYVNKRSLPSQVGQVYTEMTGQTLPDTGIASRTARLQHARQHALELA